MKKIILTTTMVLFCNSAIATEKSSYIKIGGFGLIGHKLFDEELAVPENNYSDLGFGGTIAYGNNFKTNLRAELQLSYFGGPDWAQQFHYKASGLGGFINLYADIFDIEPMKLYINGGVGASYMEAQLISDRVYEWEKKVRFAWNLGLGTDFKISDSLLIDLGYSLINLGKPEENAKTGEGWEPNSIKTHNINLGIRFYL